MPYFLAIGMSPSEFWDGDCSLCKAYLEKERILRKTRDFDQWKQGLYIHDAVAVAIARGINGDKNAKYPDSPYWVKQAETKEQVSRKVSKQFEAFADLFNAKRRENDTDDRGHSDTD